ncbi:hypothetical protein [Paenibacillus sp. IHBB 10380]|uniref:hypothetical protein n=1 Tax=Paenibacillus sp. IHBB 10380 TaxID=1566358 RepID=UPI0005CFD6BA|nr:hypothetical protein [Paenibacillus sp. IHBB 10380]AJS59868.1 hypothetical protein UB51_16830 [Paenibacillus sp. IHBB 10380]
MVLEEVEMTCTEVAEILTDPYGLTKKEQRLLAYLLEEGNSRKIGDVCKALKTTPRTLLYKTQRSLNKKLDQIPESEGQAVILKRRKSDEEVKEA